MAIAEKKVASVELLMQRVDALERENKILREEIAILRRGCFGRSSERLEPGQLALFLGEDKAVEPAEPKTIEVPAHKRAKRGHGRSPFAPNLPRVTIECDVPEEERVCSCCGKLMRPIGEDVSERGHLIPAQILVNRYVRKKYACPDGHGVVTAAAPAGVIDGAKYESSVYAYLATAKYSDHRVPRRHAPQPKGRGSVPGCTEDEGGPLGIGVQAQVPNRLELRGSRVRVVSVEGNGATRSRQVRSKKTNASEPLITCREVFTRRQNRVGWLTRDEPRSYLSTGWAASGMKAA